MQTSQPSPAYAPLIEQAHFQAARQARRERVVAVVVAVLVHALALAILALIVIPGLAVDTPPLVAREFKYTDAPDITPPTTISTTSRPKPSGASSPVARLISSNAPAAVMTPESVTRSSAVDPGVGAAMGMGMGFSGSGDGGGGGMFGRPRNDGAMLPGTIYDMKQDAGGKPVPYDINVPPEQNVFVRNIRRVIDGDFRPSAFSGLYQGKQQLYLSYLAIPGVSANEGPKAFGMEKEIQPRGWFIHYAGEITAPRSGRFRWVGLGDDLLMVFIDGKLVLNASWPDIHHAIGRGWKPNDHVNEHQSHQSPKLVYGDWVNFGQMPRRIDILFGERPGGLVGAVLLMEERGVDYPPGPQGRPLLPPFTVKPLTDADKERLANFPGFQFNLDPVVFRATPPKPRL